MSAPKNKSLALVALSLPILFTFTTGFSKEFAAPVHISGNVSSAPSGSLGEYRSQIAHQLAHISGGTSGSLFKSKTEWPSQLIASLDKASVQKTSERKSLRDGFLIENVPGLLMKSLTEEELRHAKFSPRSNTANSKTPKAGMMLASLDATEFIASASNTDSAGSYAHPGIQGNESMMGVPEGMDSAREENRKSEGSKKKKPCPKKEGSKGAKSLDKEKCDLKKGDPHHNMKGHHAEGYSHHHKMEGSKGKEGHGFKGHHGYSHHPKGEGSKGKEGYHHGSAHHGMKGHHGSSHHGHRGKHKASPFEHVIKMKDKLNLSPEQIEKLKTAEFDYNRITTRARDAHKIAHMEMDSLVHNATTDEKRLRELADIISETKSKKIHAMIEAKIAILNILSPEQKKIAASLRGDSHGHK